MTGYDQDIIAWANEQASLLRAGQFEQLDIAHLAEEIEDVGKSEQRELANRMTLLLVHLLKWEFQPERRGTSWDCTIREQRRALQRRLNKTPSLRQCLDDSDWWEDVWLDARIDASRETGIGIERFPANCPWPVEQILQPDWLPPDHA